MGLGPGTGLMSQRLSPPPPLLVLPLPPFTPRGSGHNGKEIEEEEEGEIVGWRKPVVSCLYIRIYVCVYICGEESWEGEKYRITRIP